MFETLFEKIEENDEEEYVKNEAVFKETEVISSNDGTRYEIKVSWNIDPGNYVLNNYNEAHRCSCRKIQKYVHSIYEETINIYLKSDASRK